MLWKSLFKQNSSYNNIVLCEIRQARTPFVLKHTTGTSDVLEHKGRVSLCINQTLQNNLSVHFWKYKYEAIVAIYTLASKYRATFLPQFPEYWYFLSLYLNYQ